MIAKLGVLILTGFLLLGGCAGPSAQLDGDGYGGRNGAREARQDIKNGTLTMKTYGLPDPVSARYAELLQKKLGVRRVAIADCVVTKGLLKYAKSYNDVAEAYIARKYGPQALSDLWAQAVLEEQGSR